MANEALWYRMCTGSQTNVQTCRVPQKMYLDIICHPFHVVAALKAIEFALRQFALLENVGNLKSKDMANIRTYILEDWTYSCIA